MIVDEGDLRFWGDHLSFFERYLINYIYGYITISSHMVRDGLLTPLKKVEDYLSNFERWLLCLPFYHFWGVVLATCFDYRITGIRGCFGLYLGCSTGSGVGGCILQGVARGALDYRV